MVEETLSRGTLFAFNDTLHYAYGEIGQSLQTFIVYPYDMEENNEFEEIAIDGEMYVTNFASLNEIPKKSLVDCDILANATEEEMIQIRKQKKQYKKTKAYNKKAARLEREKTSLTKVGWVVRDYTAAHRKSIVVYQKRQELLLIDKERYDREGVLEYRYFQLPQVKTIYRMQPGALKKLLYQVKETCANYLSEEEVDRVLKKLCVDNTKKKK